MSRRLQLYVVVATFAMSFVVYLILMASCGENSLFLRVARLPAGFLVVLGMLLLFAWAVSAFLDISLVLKRMFFKPKLGAVLISEGYVTEEELRQALAEQRHRIGEVLLKAGRITSDQLDQALDRQKKDPEPKRIGEILAEMGHATDEDIDWALARMKRRIGRVLLDKGLLTDYDVGWALMSQRKPKRKQAGQGPGWLPMP